MDLSKVTNIIELKAVAYDIMRERERLGDDLARVIQRIAQLEQQPPATPPKEKPGK